MVRSEGDMSLKNPVPPPGIDPGTVRLVAQRLTPGTVRLEVYLFIEEKFVNSVNFMYFFFFFFSSGPSAYAPDAPQPVGLLCYPSVLDVPTFAASPSPRPCYPKGGTAWARIMADNFA
jgi:hypothetical protein